MIKNLSKENKKPCCWNDIGVWGRSKERCERLQKLMHCHNCDVFSKAGRSIFNRRPPAGYISEWGKGIALPQEAGDKKNVGVIIFRIEKEWFAFPANIFHEITENKPVHSIPRNEAAEIAGIVNINGEVKICYSLVSLLGIDRDVGQNINNNFHIYRRLIIVMINGSYYVFQVCEVLGLYRYKADELSPAPATLEESQANFLSGLFKYDGHQVALLDVNNIKSALEGASP